MNPVRLEQDFDRESGYRSNPLRSSLRIMVISFALTTHAKKNPPKLNWYSHLIIVVACDTNEDLMDFTKTHFPENKVTHCDRIMKERTVENPFLLVCVQRVYTEYLNRACGLRNRYFRGTHRKTYPFKLSDVIRWSISAKMSQSHLSLLISHWLHERILMSASRWLAQKWYAKPLSEFLEQMWSN